MPENYFRNPDSLVKVVRDIIEKNVASSSRASKEDSTLPVSEVKEKNKKEKVDTSKKKDEIDTEPKLKVSKVYEKNDIKFDSSYEDASDNKMSDAEMEKREKIVKSLKSKTADLKKRYGDRWKGVMYAIATKMAVKENFELELTEEEIEELEEVISKSKEYAVVNSSTNKIISLSSQKEALKMLKKLNAKEKGSHYLAYTLIRKVGDTFNWPYNAAKAKSIGEEIELKLTEEEIEEFAREEEIQETAEAGLAAKAEKSGVSIDILRKVYRRGVAAWNSGHRPGTTPQQWGMARVNSYITKGKGTYHGADKDLREEESNLSRVRKDKESGLPQKYVTGLSVSTAKARAAHWQKMNKKSDKDPSAYEPAPGDATAKTKLSKHTLKYRAMFGENMDEELYDVCWNDNEQVDIKMIDNKEDDFSDQAQVTPTPDIYDMERSRCIANDVLKEIEESDSIQKTKESTLDPKILQVVRQAFADPTDRQYMMRILTRGAEKSMANPKLRPYISTLMNKFLDATKNDPTVFSKVRSYFKKAAEDGVVDEAMLPSLKYIKFRSFNQTNRADFEEADLDEGRRGRPRSKDSGPERIEPEDGGLEPIQVQLNKAINLRGMKEVEFINGDKEKVNPELARTVLNKINSLRGAKEKQMVVRFIMKSKNNLHKYANDPDAMKPQKRFLSFRYYK